MGTEADRVTTHLDLVRMELSRFRLVGSYQREEGYAAGCLGLVQAAHRWRYMRCTEKAKRTWRSFARLYIRGAIADALRALDPLPRRHRERWKRMAALAERLGQRVDRVNWHRHASSLGVRPSSCLMTLALYQTFVSRERM